MNYSPADLPKLAFACPKLWADMRGDERTRFCDVCGMHVHDLSALAAEERAALVQNSTGRLCVGYQQRLTGEFVTPDSPLTARERQNLRQIGTVALAGAALILAGGCVANQSTIQPPPPAPLADTTSEVPATSEGDEPIVLSAFGLMVAEPAPAPGPHHKGQP